MTGHAGRTAEAGAPGAQSRARRVRIVRSLLPFVGLPLLVWLLVRIGVASLAGVVASADICLLAASLLMTPVVQVLASLRWQMLLRQYGIRLGFWSVFTYNLLGQFYGLVTPGKIGSFVRISLIAEDTEAPLIRRVLSVLLDRMGDVFGLLALGSGGCVVLALKLGRPDLALAAGIIIAIGILMLAGIAFWRPQHLLPRIGLLIPASVRARVGWRASDLVLPPIHALVVPVLLSVCVWAAVTFQAWVVARAMAIQFPCLDFVLVMPLASMVGLVPVSISGFGTRDAAVIGLASVYGVAADKALGMSLLAYCVNAVFPSLVGAVMAGGRALVKRGR